MVGRRATGRATLLAHAVALAVALAALFRPAPAAASPFELFGFGSRAIAMGGAQGAAARDHSSIFYNPANLALRRTVHFGASLTLIEPTVSLAPAQPNPALEASLPGRNVSLALGFSFPLGGLLDYRVAVGFALSVPLVELTRLTAVDPARPHFYLYEGLADNLIIAPALGFRLLDWLRVGVGVQILAALGAELQVTGDLVRRRIEERSLTVDLSGTTAPIVGLHVLAGPLEVGLTYRGDLALAYRIPVDFLLEGVGVVDLDVHGTSLYSPRQLNLGLAYTLEKPALTFAFDATLALWSEAPSPAGNISVRLTDEELRPNEPTVETLLDLATTPFDLGAQDILIPRLGVEWRATELWTVRAGYFHRPTPLPDQTGFGNVLDATANVFSLGAGVTFPDPLQIEEQPATIDIHVQWTHLSQRLVVKDPARGATFEGRYLAGGSVWNIGIELRHDF
jgi:hypothetical protein